MNGIQRRNRTRKHRIKPLAFYAQFDVVSTNVGALFMTVTF